MENNNVSASLICLDPLNLEREVSKLVSKGITRFHADFMDNTLVPRLGITPETIQQLKVRFEDDISIDSHLMVKNPERCLDVIAPYSDWITIHYEAQEDPLRIVQKIKKAYKCKAGLAFNVLSEIPRWVLECEDVDGILLMGISPGVLGTNHYPDIVYQKLSDIRKWFKIKPVFIDGSVNFETIKKYFKDPIMKKFLVVVCGSSTLMKRVNFEQPFRLNDQIIDENIQELYKCIQ